MRRHLQYTIPACLNRQDRAETRSLQALDQKNVSNVPGNSFNKGQAKDRLFLVEDSMNCLGPEAGEVYHCDRTIRQCLK